MPELTTTIKRRYVIETKAVKHEHGALLTM